MINTIIRLRRDNEFNYDKVKNSFIPANGEICLVDTARNGLRVICGDGKTTFGNLEFIDNFIQKGYYKEGIFYKDYNLTEQISGAENKLFIDLNTSGIYFFNGYSFDELNLQIPTASSKTAGIMKLYSEVGYNTDGTMT